MKLLADQAIVGLELFSPFFDCVTVPAEAITAKILTDVDILLTRSVTKVNASLLKDSGVQFIGSCTIGVDHIDLNYLRAEHIRFEHAPGCNAIAVSEYVLQTICHYAVLQHLSWQALKVGIVGWGNVGKAVTHLLDALKIDYVVYDPPLQAASSKIDATHQNLRPLVPRKGWGSLDDILSCSVITIHVPLLETTRHLLTLEQLSRIQPASLLINTSRGEIIDEAALFAHFSPDHFFIAVDVFAHEPIINTRWLCYAWQMTPHIAGHSQRGKWRGTEMIYDALRSYLFQQGHPVQLPIRGTDYAPSQQTLVYDQTSIAPSAAYNLLRQIFDLQFTDQQLRQLLARRTPVGDSFRQARVEYPARREFRDVSLKVPDRLKNSFTDLRFCTTI